LVSRLLRNITNKFGSSSKKNVFQAPQNCDVQRRSAPCTCYGPTMIISVFVGHLLSDHSNHANIELNEMTGWFRHQPNSNTNKARKPYITY